MPMPDAACENCDHEWTLTKPPQDYSRGWPSCPECGSTRVTVEGQEKSQTPVTPEQAQAAGEAAGGQIQTEEQAAQMQAGGEQIAATLAPALDDGAEPERRAEGIMRGTQLLGGLVSGVMKYNQRKQEAAEKRAKGANLQPVEDKPTCECGYTFSAIDPAASRVQCPKCGAEYEVVG